MNRLMLTGFSTLLLSVALTPVAKANELAGRTNYPNDSLPDIEVFDEYRPGTDYMNPPGTMSELGTSDSETYDMESNRSMEENSAPAADNAPSYEGVPEIEATDDMEADPSGRGIGLEPQPESEYDGYDDTDQNGAPAVDNAPGYEGVPEIEATDDMGAAPSGEEIGQ